MFPSRFIISRAKTHFVRTGQKVSFLVAGFLFLSWLAANGQMEMINDRHFQTGFVVLAPSGSVEGNMQYTTANGSPQWLMGQWNSVQSIYGTSGQNLPDGSVKWQNSYKTVIQAPSSSTSADLVLGVNSINEYGNTYRSAMDPWPALLVQQSISEPGGWRSSTAPSIAQMSQAVLNLDIKLTKADNRYTEGYNPAIHASQFLIYFTIQNLNPESPGFGKYLWFGTCVYDDRYTVTNSYSLLDLGTQSLIYAVGLSDLGFEQGPQVGESINLNYDMLPHIQAALQYAWDHDYLTESMDPNDYKIGAMNLGWEVPGLADVEMQVKDLSLTVAVPEPSAFVLSGCGLMLLLWRRVRCRRDSLQLSRRRGI